MKHLKVGTDFAADISQLGDAETGRLFRAMLNYAATGKEPALGGNERILWGTAKKIIDAQRVGYDNKCASIAAAREWNPNNNKTVSEQTENGQTTDSNQSPNSQKPDSKREKEAGEKEKKERTKEKREKAPEEKERTPPNPPAPPGREPLVAELLTESGEELRTAVDEWLRYKREKRQTYQPIGLKMLLNKIKRYADNCGEQAVIAAIHDAMSQNYQGIVWDRLVKKPQQPQQPRQQNGGMQAKYDMMDRWRNGRK